ncbi:pyridoxamine 5'-phosphate oxidase family protein [Catellatospora tritici]|uniref:pyridoxamine 5'-phosphate oxidase family protein n=1 Tax=Catellatospora tritici TaxID=2851566 RepID=UPI001C2D48F5|nr:pyridoxamine 5'-phosphate oxidase family protein [Catellatospora tritici]MBV1849374.1 pyridoxamine 5'-phosphate oxidase family protein [Catellatospora tritici]
MTVKVPVAELLLPGWQGTPAKWGVVADALAKTDKFWLATLTPSGRPHVRPLFAVWADGAVHFASARDAAKSRNLTQDGRSSITASCDGFDLVIEGTATEVTGAAGLQRVVDAYRSKYGWQVSVRDDALHADYAAPTAGKPPYAAYRLDPVTAFGFPSAEGFTPTRWRF